MTAATPNRVTVDPAAPDPATLRRAANILRAGGLVAFPTETVYGLGAHALDVAAVAKIFRAKQRPAWDPLIVHISSVAMATDLARSLPPPFAELTAAFWPGPLTLVIEKSARVPDEVTAGRSTVAVRLPQHPVAAALLRESQMPIAAPSANRFGRPSPTNADHVLADLGDRVDLVLDAGPTPLGVESTVLDLTVSPPAIRRPGGVSREALEQLIGPVAVRCGVTEEPGAGGLEAPGLTAKHYAPRARVELFDGDPAAMVGRIRARAVELKSQRRRVGVLLHAEAGAVPEADVCLAYGPWGDWPRMAARLFAFLRQMDERDVEVILAILPPPAGLGLALRDRLQRAAGTES